MLPIFVDKISYGEHYLIIIIQLRLCAELAITFQKQYLQYETLMFGCEQAKKVLFNKLGKECIHVKYVFMCQRNFFGFVNYFIIARRYIYFLLFSIHKTINALKSNN